MEDESTGSSGIINWLTRLTRKVTSGKIVPMYYGENPPPRSPTLFGTLDGVDNSFKRLKFRYHGMFANCQRRGLASPSRARNKRRIMFPCPLHSILDSESQTEIIRRSKLAQSWGLDVKWVDHQVLESMIIINPPSDNGMLTMALRSSICHCHTWIPWRARSLKSPERIKRKYFLISSNHLARHG